MRRLTWYSSLTGALIIVIGFSTVSCATEGGSETSSETQAIVGYPVVPIAETILTNDPAILDSLPSSDEKEIYWGDSIAPEDIVSEKQLTEQEVKEGMSTLSDPNTQRINRVCFRLNDSSLVRDPFSTNCCHKAECCVVTWRRIGGVPIMSLGSCVVGYVDCIVKSSCSR